jgi:glycerol-3-phosphate dehydrogenase (NAD(P)+)
MNISILGAGAWGTALAIAVSRQHQVMLWGRDSNLMHHMQTQRENTKRLPAMRLPDALVLTADLTQALAHAKQGLLILATSVAGLRPTLQTIHTHELPNVVWLCKGVETQTNLLPHQIVQQELGDQIACGALSWIAMCINHRIIAFSITRASGSSSAWWFYSGVFHR